MFFLAFHFLIDFYVRNSKLVLQIKTVLSFYHIKVKSESEIAVFQYLFLKVVVLKKSVPSKVLIISARPGKQTILLSCALSFKWQSVR